MRSVLIAVVYLSVSFAGRFVMAAEDSLYLGKEKWINQKGNAVSLQSLKGHPRILTMIFTRCPEACPMIVVDIKKLERGLKPDLKKRIRFTLFSFDSKRDTPASLNAFHKKMKLDDRWDLFVADAPATRELAALFEVQYKELPNGDYVHSTSLIAVDEEGRPLARREEFNAPVTFLTDALNKLSKLK